MENQVPIEILRVYMKDVSFETPNSPETFQVEGEARITVDYQINSQKLQEMEDKNIFESSLTITAHALLGEKTVYLLEATQAAIIALPKLPNSENKMFLNGYCPDMLLPYLREFVSSMTTRGTVPMLMLKPESFSARVMMEMQQRQEQQGKEEQAKLDA
jgi:preprotein translocase subunit SecB